MRESIISKVKKAVIKVGSSVLAQKDGGLSLDIFGEIAGEVHKLRSKNIEVVIVSSGAIALGMKKLKLKNKPEDISMKQAIAACGQNSLIGRYEQAFSEYGINVAQILVTHAGLSDRKRFLNARKTILTLLQMGVVPVVNENDTVAIEEIMIGDNDNLAASVTTLIEADLLVMLTDIEGLYSKDPRHNHDAVLISTIDKISEEILNNAGDTLGATTTGGMKTKIEAAAKAAAFGVPTVIANGRRKGELSRVFEGGDAGTLILPSEKSIKGRKHWIAFTLKPSGELVLDQGAVKALTSSGKSLLPSGIKDVRGEFGVGEPVSCIDESGAEIARGLTSYGSGDIKKIAGLKTSQIESVLGYKYSDEVIHRDDLAIITK